MQNILKLTWVLYVVLLFSSCAEEYEYVVPVEIWEQFKEASSKGKFFNSVIKGRFKPEIV